MAAASYASACVVAVVELPPAEAGAEAALVLAESAEVVAVTTAVILAWWSTRSERPKIVCVWSDRTARHASSRPEIWCGRGWMWVGEWEEEEEEKQDGTKRKLKRPGYACTPRFVAPL